MEVHFFAKVLRRENYCFLKTLELEIASFNSASVKDVIIYSCQEHLIRSIKSTDMLKSSTHKEWYKTSSFVFIQNFLQG